MADKGLVITLNKKACIFADPAKYPEAAKLANSYFCPLGPEPGVGHVLMMQSDLSAIDTTGDMTLAFDDDTLVKFTKLQFVNAMAVSEGTLTANRVYLVKVADKRLGYKKFAPPLNKAYNVRSYVSLREPTETAKIVAADCYSESLNTGALWTWETMLQNIWTNGSYGTWPGLPSTPAGYPEGFHFTGESNWEALNGVLDLLDFAIKYDPFTGNLSIVDLTTEQSGLSAAIKAIGPTLDSADPYWGAKSYYPTSVKVQYDTQFAMYGNLPDAELTGNVLFGTVKTYTKATGKANANSGSVIKNEQEKYVREEYAGTEWADRDTEATDKKDRWLLRQAKAESFARIRCQGIVKTVSPGSQVKAVLWRNWGNGTLTEIARFPGFASMRNMLDASIDSNEPKIECLKWIDLARQGNTKYPQVMQWVQLDRSSDNKGLAEANEQGVYTGRIISPDASRNQTAGTLTGNVTWDNVEDCFVVFCDYSKVPRCPDVRYLGRFAGSIKSTDVNGTPRVMPLLVVEDRGEVLWELSYCRKTLSEPEETIYVTNDLSDYYGKVIKISDDERCYEVLANCNNTDCVDPRCVTVIEEYTDCTYCRACWKLTRCDDEEEIKYTKDNLEQYEGQVVKIQGDDYCWEVSLNDEECTTYESVTVEQSYSDCDYCGRCYELENCNDDTDTIIVDFDPIQYYPDLEIEDIIEQEKVFRIDGRCYKIISEPETCTESEVKEPTESYDYCNECQCYKLVNCDDEEDILIVHAADGPNGSIDLADYANKVVRTDDDKCYQVQEATEACGESSVAVTIVEAYDDCETCNQNYRLVNCDDEEDEIITYTDLSAFTVGSYIRKADEDPIVCYEIAEVVEFDGDAVAFDYVESKEFETCETCKETQLYKLTQSCNSDQCDEEEAGEGPAAEIITDSDLSDEVDQYIKIGGKCYLVETVGSGTPTTVDDYKGPFETCEICQQEPVTTKQRILTNIEIVGTDIVASVSTLIFTDGLLTGICGGGDDDKITLEGTECP